MLLLGHYGPWSLGKHQFTSFHQPPPLAPHNFSQKLERLPGRYLAVALWEGRVDSFTRCTYTSYVFLSLSIAVVNCCFTGRLVSSNCPSAFAQRCVALYWLCQDEKNIWPYPENLCQLPVLLLLATPLVFYHQQIISVVIFMGEGLGIQSLITALNSDSWHLAVIADAHSNRIYCTGSSAVSGLNM